MHSGLRNINVHCAALPPPSPRLKQAKTPGLDSFPVDRIGGLIVRRRIPNIEKVGLQEVVRNTMVRGKNQHPVVRAVVVWL